MDRRSNRQIRDTIRSLRDRMTPVVGRIWPLAMIALSIVMAACSSGNGGSSGY